MRKRILIFVCIFILAFIGIILYFSFCNTIPLFNNGKIAINKQNESGNITVVDVTNLELGDGTGHQHVFKTQYDENEHWEECTLCHLKEKNAVHSFTQRWILGYESCESNNARIDTCLCGYSKEWHRPCVFNNKYAQDHSQHYPACSYGHTLTQYGYYINSYNNGNIHYFPENKRCIIPGGQEMNCYTPSNIKCTICGAYSNNNHSLYIVDRKIICEICSTEFGEILENKFEIIENNENIPPIHISTIKLKLINGARFGEFCGFWGKKNLQLNKQSKVDNSDGTITITTEMRAKSSVKTILKDNITIFSNINGKTSVTFIDTVNIYSDCIKPEISSIETNEGKDLTEWSRTKPIVVSGTENWCNTVKVKIVELDNEENVIFEGETTVNENQYSISCTPEIECSLARKDV